MIDKKQIEEVQKLFGKVAEIQRLANEVREKLESEDIEKKVMEWSDCKSMAQIYACLNVMSIMCYTTVEWTDELIAVFDIDAVKALSWIAKAENERE
jgi:hypothetical protein